jgi:hypothetical protein
VKYFNQTVLLVMGIHASLLLSGCSNVGDSVKEKVPVFINSELTMSAYMSDTKTIDDLAGELGAPWSIKITVKQVVGEKIRDVDSCDSIISAYDDNFEPINSSFHTTFQNALMQCRAISIAVNMKPSNLSYITPNLDKISVSNFPATLAFIPSKSKKSSIENDISLTNINEVTPLIDFTSQSNYEVELKIDGGTQTIVVLAKGDVDGDQLEDLLIRVINASEKGSYRATHLFVLTKKENEGNWLLLSKY